MEQIEVDWYPRWDDDERPAKSIYQEWVDHYLHGMDQLNRTARLEPEKTRQMLEAAGFTDIQERVQKVYVCPWIINKEQREFARWFNLGLSHSLEAFSMIPLIDKLGMRYDDVRSLCAGAKEEICKLRYHTYCNV